MMTTSESSGQAPPVTVIAVDGDAVERAHDKRVAAVAYYQRELAKAKTALAAADDARGRALAAVESKIEQAAAEVDRLRAAFTDAARAAEGD